MTRPRIAFSWNGLPQYAARLIRAAIDRLGYPCPVLGSRAEVPVRGVEEALGFAPILMDPAVPATWRGLGLEVPELFFQSGRAYAAFRSLGDEVRARGGRIVVTNDATMRYDARQFIGAVWWRLFGRRRYDGMFVPGASGRQVARMYGVPDDRIWEGLLGGDPSIFPPGPPPSRRSKRIQFVGRFIPHKGVRELTAAFAGLADAFPDWTLHICGSGPLRDALGVHPRIIVEDFVQPEALATRYHDSRWFVLPSTHEPWGLVVHEAALTGTPLLLSDAIGSGHDFAGETNAVRFRAGDPGALTDALRRAMTWNDDRLDAAGRESLRRAERFGPARFAETVAEIARTLL